MGRLLHALALSLSLFLVLDIVKGESDNQSSSQTEVVETFDHDLVFWALKQRRFFLYKTLAYYTDPVKDTAGGAELKKNKLFESFWNGEIWTMAADYHAKRLYYTDHIANFIGVYDLKTKENIKVFQGMAWGIDSISVDWVSGNVYWADSYFDWIMVANRNFSYYTNVVSINSNIPAKIAVHPEERYLYWTEKGVTSCRIWRSDLQGYDHELLHTFNEVQTISDVAIDFARNRFYWGERLKMDGGISRIRYFDFDDLETVHTLFTANTSYFFGLASYKEHLYVTDDLQKTLFVVNKETGAVVINQRFHYSERPRDVSAFSSVEQPISDDDKTHQCTTDPCEHICLARYGINQYACECKIGFRLQTDGRTCAVDMVNDNFAILMDSKHSKLYQMSMAGPLSPQEIQVDEVKAPSSAVYEPRSSMVYWADEKLRKIARTSLLGRGQMTLVSDVHVYSIALDPGADNLYWIDAEKDAMFVSRLDGSHPKTLLIKNLQRVFAMTIDTERGFLYWSDWGQVGLNGSQHGVIESARLDGSERRMIIEAGSTPHGLTLDKKRNILFWTQLRTNQIGWFNLNNNETGKYNISETKKRTFPVSLAYHEDYLYITDMSNRHLLRVQSDDVIRNTDDAVRTFGPGLFYQLSGISIYQSETHHPGSTACGSAKCPQLCLPVHSSSTSAIGHRCECQDHYKYVAASNSCEQVSSTDDDIPPTFGDTCPSDTLRVYAEECSEVAHVDFTVPTATDNSGNPVLVRSSIKGQPPYNMTEGRRVFLYKATDTNGNSAQCQFIVVVEVRTCYEFAREDKPEEAVLGTPSCGYKVGSVIDVTCPDRDGTAFQYVCMPSLDWEPVGAPTCDQSVVSTTHPPTPTPVTPKIHDITANTDLKKPSAAPSIGKVTTSVGDVTTTSNGTEPKFLQSNSTNTTSLAVGLVVAVLVVLLIIVAIVLVYRRYYSGQPWAPGSKWRRVEDRVQLTGASTESGIYVGDQHEATNRVTEELNVLSSSDRLVI